MHSEDYKRALVDEALNRTPMGGFPELERREGLEPGTLSAWRQCYGPPPPPTPFSSLHFWIGATTLTEAEFYAYFLIPEAHPRGEDAPAIDAGFCADLCDGYAYDEDLLQVEWLDAAAPVEEIIGQSTIRSDSLAVPVIAACAKRGIHSANAMFVYADPAQAVPDAGRLYNGLPYIGLFPNERPSKPRLRHSAPRTR